MWFAETSHSHAHPDHVGRASLFLSSTTLLVGPGVKTLYYPGWPANSESPVFEREFADREVKEVNFSASNLEIGGFKALDFFGDGSFYFLSAPGHAVGHLNALARTTQQTFMYLGADSFHHGSMLRPHSDSRLPDDVRLPSLCCSCEALRAIHPLAHLSEAPERYHATFGQQGTEYREVPFHTVSQTETGDSLAIDIEEARTTIKKVQKFDKLEDVFVVAAHDTSLYGVLEYFPKEANAWKEKGWKEKGKWLFLDDMKAALDLTGATTKSGT